VVAVSGLLLAVGVGLTGALGAGARYAIVKWVARWWRGPLPVATLIINLSGAFALGVVTVALATSAQLPARLLLGAGFLGGYTTFSALSFEALALTRRGEVRDAWLFVGGSLACGMIAAALGMALGAAL
jgi:CrcB protein